MSDQADNEGGLSLTEPAPGVGPLDPSPGARVEARLIRGPVGAHLCRLTLPMMAGILAVLLFQIVDTFFVGQLGTEELAALGFTFPITFLVMSLALGLGIGTASVLARVIGAGESERAQRLTTDSLLLAVAVVTPVAFAGLFFINGIFGALGASDRVLELVRDYMNIWFLGVALLVVPMVGNAAIRATGDTRTPSLIMVFAGTINLILDPLLIFGYLGFPRLEVQGAAIATVVSWGFTFVAALWLLARRERLIDFSRPALGEVWRSWKQVLHVGVPAAGTSMLVPLSATVLTGLVAGFGDEAVAAYGVGSRIEPIAMIGMMALSSGLPVFVGQNWGAGLLERVRTAVRQSMIFSMVWGVAVWALLVVTARPIGLLFNDDPRVVEILVDFLVILPISYGFAGATLLASSTLNALNRPYHSAIFSGARLFGLYVPLAWLCSRWWGVSGIFIGGALANVIAGICAAYWIRAYLTEDNCPTPRRDLVDRARREREERGAAEQTDDPGEPAIPGSSSEGSRPSAPTDVGIVPHREA